MRGLRGLVGAVTGGITPVSGLRRPRLLDLFCKAGGASMGYWRAGFDVVGVDLEVQPRYPFEFLLADALDVLDDAAFLAGFDVVVSSPPCQAYSSLTRYRIACGQAVADHPRLIGPVRDRLVRWGGPYVVENVVGAPLRDPVKLCGSSFGLAVRRHRLFETNLPLRGPACRHREQGQPIGVYGGRGSQVLLRSDGSPSCRVAVSTAEARAAMGIDWMTWGELTQAIPPAYTEHLGTQILECLSSPLEATKLRRRRSRFVAPRRCPCGRPLDPAPTGRPPRHCSTRCRQAAFRERRRNARTLEG